MTRLYVSNISCSVNPYCGKEAEITRRPASTEKKKVSIIGAGPGGMEAALTAGQRGHEVKLYEKTGELGGGQLRLCVNLPGKEGMASIARFHENMYKNYDNIQVILNTEADASVIEKDKPDVIVIATGAKASMPDIPGIDRKNVVSSFDVLEGKANVGNSVVIVGGGLIGSELAEYFAAQGKKVQILEMAADIATTMSPFSKIWFLMQFGMHGVQVATNMTVKEFTDDGVIAVDSEGNDVSFTADTVVAALGTTPDNALMKEMEKLDADIYMIGDAKVSGKVFDAVKDGFDVAFNI
jgi:NADPH-dependent 2,4-dienoyl-CoA reductase/sulfur reductase-like enzyme